MVRLPRRAGAGGAPDDDLPRGDDHRAPPPHRAGAPDRLFAEVERLGGRAGWPYGNVLWRIRGFLDRLVGGVGMRLGRRSPTQLRVGDALDFWRVEAVERPTLLRLRAEMRVPGRAWLQYEVTETPRGSRLEQTAFFEPKGLPGLAYWYLLYPIHGLIFRGTVRRLAARALAAPTGTQGSRTETP